MILEQPLCFGDNPNMEQKQKKISKKDCDNLITQMLNEQWQAEAQNMLEL